MKTMRYALAALICYAAFWGAAHIGLLPGLAAGAPDTLGTQATTGAATAQKLSRIFPVIR
ncbi:MULTISPECIES: hypothetical protein [unclassified Sphingobium]|uniref:hypothetical protein n=1 Tax=unclassified Sphingobium TaxID=2611147 RepID=UPI0035A71A8B